MMKKTELYYDMWKDCLHGHPSAFLYIVIGQRGRGKTYSTLNGLRLSGSKFMYVRRTQTELDNTCTETKNPFKKINSDHQCDIEIRADKESYIIIDNENKDDPQLIGYAAALSTFGKFRGSDFSDVDYIFYDEFINTGSVNNIRHEADMFFNLIETVNRNRELEGQQAIKIFMASNANTIDNDIIRSLRLADQIKEMKENKIEDYEDKERGIFLKIMDSSGTFTDLKMQTRLYKLTEGTSFYEMALNNEFTSDYFGDTKKVNYKELRPVVSFNGLTFYSHKSNDLIYCSKRKADCTNYDIPQRKQFQRDFGFYLSAYYESGRMIFQDYNVKLEALNII